MVQHSRVNHRLTVYSMLLLATIWSQAILAMEEGSSRETTPAPSTPSSSCFRPLTPGTSAELGEPPAPPRTPAPLNTEQLSRTLRYARTSLRDAHVENAKQLEKDAANLVDQILQDTQKLASSIQNSYLAAAYDIAEKAYTGIKAMFIEHCECVAESIMAFQLAERLATADDDIYHALKHLTARYKGFKRTEEDIRAIVIEHLTVRCGDTKKNKRDTERQAPASRDRNRLEQFEEENLTLTKQTKDSLCPGLEKIDARDVGMLLENSLAARARTTLFLANNMSKLPLLVSTCLHYGMDMGKTCHPLALMLEKSQDAILTAENSFVELMHETLLADQTPPLSSPDPTL